MARRKGTGRFLAELIKTIVKHPPQGGPKPKRGKGK